MGEKTFIFPEAGELAQALATHVLRTASEAVATRQRFTLALSGGSALTLLAQGLDAVDSSPAVDWLSWHIYWADERCVPLTHPDSNFAAAQQVWLSHSPIPPDHIHAADDVPTPEAAAEAYAAELTRCLQPAAGTIPQFDLILLGVGEDGHTASLFPGNPALEERSRWVVAVANAPKPPPNRLSLTLPVINHAREVAVVAVGAGKKAVVTRVREQDITEPLLPIQRIRPVSGQLRWFLDSAAAGIQEGIPDLNQGVQNE